MASVSTSVKSPPTCLLRPQSLREEIVHFLQQDILTGVFQPGQRIVERELVQRFGVSSIPVREALQALESNGLLVRRLNYGYSVIQLTDEEALRICELRSLLEPKVVEWAATRITPEGAAELDRRLDDLYAAAQEDDMAAFFHTDLLLHQCIWNLADNHHAAKALETSVGSLFASGLANSMRAATAGTAVPIDRMGEVEKHRRMVNAIKRGAGARAAQVLSQIAAGFERHFRNRSK
jgi:DNA-binding GntR family transcriptional regulator